MKFKTILAVCSLALPLALTGCDGGGDGTPDIGDNNANLVACIGDSLTQGYNCEGASYPTRLASMSGKTVSNYGVGGSLASYGASIIGSVLNNKPGYVCILFGSNDAIRGVGTETFKSNIRAIVQACKNNKSVPILGTPPRMIYGHTLYDGDAKRMGDAVKQVASEEGCAVIDFYAAFGDGTQYINEDGLHLTDAGGDLIARRFNDKI